MTKKSSENPCIGCLVIVGCENMCAKAKVWYDNRTTTIPESEFDWRLYNIRRNKLLTDIFEKNDRIEREAESSNIESIEK